MKVFIISDMEGVAGITKWEQVSGGHAHYAEGQKLYTAEMNAACLHPARPRGQSRI